MFGGNVPFVTEDDPVGAYQPEPIGAQELFNYIETELTDIEGNMPAPGQNDYGRADQAAVWTLLTKLYLNAEVYIDEARYDDAVTYANNVIEQGGYTLESDYQNLFLADNHEANGVIFAIPFDGVNTQTFGGTTFIAHAAVGGSMNAAEFGLDGGWAGHRVTPEFVSLFEEGDDYPGYESDNPDDKIEIYVPGNYQSASGYGNDWTPQDAPRLIAEGAEEDSVFTGYIYIGQDDTELKFTLDSTWNEPVGLDGDGYLRQDPGSANISVAKEGMYHFKVNLKDIDNPDIQRIPVFNRDINFKNSRDQFHNHNQNLEIETIAEFTNGHAMSKWKNITKDGQTGSDLTFVDIDFPMFRLADVYLMYAEATLRGNSGDMNKAVRLINDLRERAYGDASANITSGELTLDFILDERARELYWEGHRRTDLIRFGEFTGNDYVWSWKGETSEGRGTDERYNLFPIPASDVNSNLNLEQNPGY
jgi:hypothetical protein